MKRIEKPNPMKYATLAVHQSQFQAASTNMRNAKTIITEQVNEGRIRDTLKTNHII